MKQNELFFRRVEKHEREWGNQSYPGRPTLMEIMTAPIVIFWEGKEKRVHEVISLHQSLDEVERYFLRMLIARKSNSEDNQRVADIFKDQKRMTIKSVNIVFGEANEG
ncbi:MAG: hypothetical protein ACOCYT_00510 [Chloroflexota bacterium]